MIDKDTVGFRIHSEAVLQAITSWFQVFIFFTDTG
jgi:hypothetical protein